MDLSFAPTETQSVWDRMKTCGKPIVLYGMGNGADKILSVMEKYGIEAADFFASDGFVRGHSFHGKRVLSYSEAREKYKDMLVVISFGSALPEVLSRFYEIADTYETVAPDVPVSGDILFNDAFFSEHRAEFDEAYRLLADEESRRIYRLLIDYKISGKISYLREAVSDEMQVTKELVQPENITSYMDLGAYNGDTVRRILDIAPNMETVYAMEPDARNYKKLALYAEAETRASVEASPFAAWNEDTELIFRVEGNRNSTVSTNGTMGVAVSQAKEKIISARRPDTVLAGRPADYIKYDVEGAER